MIPTERAPRPAAPGRWWATIGLRLGLLNGALIFAALMGLAVAGLFAVDRVLVSGAERTILDEVLDVAALLEKRPHTREEVADIIASEAAREYTFDLRYRVTTEEGALVAAQPADFWPRVAWRPATDLPAFETLHLPGERHRVRVGRKRLQHTPPVVIEVAVVLAEEDLAMADLRRAAALAIPAVIVVAAVLGAFLARRALGPIDAIERAARTIGAGLHGQRLPAAGTNDELDRLSETLNGMLERLERAARRNLAFAADVAHEVRTPLAVVRARIEEALAAGEGSGPALEAALGGVLRIEDMVKQLLALARSDEGTPPRSAAVVDLSDIAREVIDFFAPAAEARGRPLELTVAGPALVSGDRTSLSRAVANLIDNAMAYDPSRSPVEVRVGAGGAGRVELSVADRGPGIPDELRPVIFDRFVRGPGASTARPDGAGLGLALVRSVARQLGGDAEHEPREGGGSIFRLRLPRAPA